MSGRAATCDEGVRKPAADPPTRKNPAMSDATYAGGLPPAGWYPDPDVPGQHRWWDGYQWYASAAPQRAGLGATPALATALVWLIGLQGVIGVVLVGLYVWGHVNLAGDTPYEASLTAYDVVDGALTSLSGLLFLASIVVWCFWQHGLAVAVPRDRIRRSPGMHVGSWFIPVVMLWFPYQNIKDLWDALVGRRVPMLLGGWWTLWIISSFTGRAVTKLAFSDTSSVRDVNDASLIDAAFEPGLAVLAIVIVLRLTRAARAQEAAKIEA